jgi:3-isopropylmalate/(R)-2-methylmalate dehydratase small subunit
MDYGFEAVVSEKFGDIFRNNCTKQGLLPVEVDPVSARTLMDAVLADAALEITIDVARGTIEAPKTGFSAVFTLDEFTRERLLNGWDEIGLTLRHSSDIDSYEGSRPTWMPVSALSG